MNYFDFKTDDAPFVYESGLLLRFVMLCRFEINRCAADFALLNLPKGKSLGRSKPATNSSNEQAH